jgi:hypothetical protein
MKPKNKNADALALGAKKAELNALNRQADALKTKLQTGQRELKAGWKHLAARLKKMDIVLPLGADGEPDPADVERALAEAEGFNVRTKQLADIQVASLGFTPESVRERLGQSFADCFKAKP